VSIGASLACIASLSPLTASAETAEAIIVTGASCGAVEGTPMSGTIATFTDTDASVPAATFRATIDWGDGTIPSKGTISGANGAFSVAATHTYTAQIPMVPVLVIVSNNSTSVGGSVQFWFDVVDGDHLTVADHSTIVVPSGGRAFSGVVASFRDTNTKNVPANFHPTIDWGDGSAPVSGVVSGAGSGAYTVSGTHAFATAGTYVPIVTLAENLPGDASATTAADPDESLVVAGGNVCGATEGFPVSGTVATFTDSDTGADAGQFAAQIDWGDGSQPTDGVVSGSHGVFTVSGSHLYLDEMLFDPATVAITMTHGSTEVTETAHVGFLVGEGDALVGSPVAIEAAPNIPFSGTVATFTDANVNNPPSKFSAIIDWGDGTVSTDGTISAGSDPGSFVVAGHHTYASEGTFNVTVEMDENAPGNAGASAISTANVAERVEVTGTLTGATEDAPVSGVLATFTDPIPSLAPSDFTATIDWGDGTSLGQGTIGQANGPFTVSGTHTYGDEASSVSVVVTVTHTATGRSGSATMTLPVAEGDALTGSAVSIAATAGTPFSGKVASFSDTNVNADPSDFSATIDWGDGSAPTAGTIAAGAPGSMDVAGTHTYSAAGSFTVTVTIADDPPGTATETVAGTATVAEDPPAPSLADLAVALDGPSSAIRGGALTYTMKVTNLGPGPATSVHVGFLMPWGTSFVSADPDATVLHSFLSWPRVTLAPGASATYTIQLTAPSDPWASHLVAFGGAVSRVRDPNPWNNVAASSTTLTAPTVPGSPDRHHHHHGHHH
jgi:uncharacterized repeat protein (TIGR01451 family)